MSFLLNWFGSNRNSGREDSIGPPLVLEHTEESILRGDNFTTSTPAMATRPETQTGELVEHAEERGLPPQPPNLSTNQGRSIQTRAQVHQERNQDQIEADGSEFSTETDDGRQHDGPQTAVIRARSSLRVAKQACQEEFKRLSKVDFMREVNVERLTLTQMSYHQLMNKYQEAADQLHALLHGKKLSDQKRTFKLSYANYLRVGKQLAARIRQLQRPSEQSRDGQNQQNPNHQQRVQQNGLGQGQRNVRFQAQEATQQEARTTTHPQQTFQHPTVSQPGGTQRRLNSLNESEDRILQDLMQRAGLNPPFSTQVPLQQPSCGYGQFYNPPPQIWPPNSAAPYQGSLPQWHSGAYGQGSLPYPSATQGYYQPRLERFEQHRFIPRCFTQRLLPVKI